MANGSWNLVAYYEDHTHRIVKAKGANIANAATRMFLAERERGNNFVMATTLNGHRPFYPPKQRHPREGGFKLEDCVSPPQSETPHSQQRVFRGIKANRERAAVGTDIPGPTHDALHPIASVVVPQHILDKHTTSNFGKMLRIAPFLPDPFTIDDVIARLVLQGYPELASKRPSVTTVINDCVNTKGLFLRAQERARFMVNRDSKFFASTPPAPESETQPEVEAQQPEQIATAQLTPQTAPKPTPAALSPTAEFERFLAAASTAVMVSESDRQIIERALESTLALSDLLERMLSISKVRSIFSASMRAASNGHK